MGGGGGVTVVQGTGRQQAIWAMMNERGAVREGGGGRGDGAPSHQLLYLSVLNYSLTMTAVT